MRIRCGMVAPPCTRKTSLAHAWLAGLSNANVTIFGRPGVFGGAASTEKANLKSTAYSATASDDWGMTAPLAATYDRTRSYLFGSMTAASDCVPSAAWYCAGSAAALVISQ